MAYNVSFGVYNQSDILEAHRAKIEHYGIVMETMGLSPVAARVFIYLLFSTHEQGTFEQIVAYFQVSKSAVSNALKLLAAHNMIESKTIGGQRKRYFEVNFQKMFDQREITSRFQSYSAMLDDIRQSRSVEDTLSKEMENVSSLYKMMIVEFPMILEKWKQLHTNK